MKSIAFGLIAALAAAPVTAQTWTASGTDTGALIYGATYAPEFSMMFACTAPSQGGRPLIETGDHETQQTDPYFIRIDLSYAMAEPNGFQAYLRSASLTLDDTTYRLPEVVWDEFYGSWSVHLPLTDPMFADLRRAQRLVLDPGLGIAYAYPVDGLAEGLDAAIARCTDGWVAAGFATPAWMTVAPAPAPAPPPTHFPPTLNAAAAEGCNGTSVTIDPASVQRVDLDGDGSEDYVLNHNGVRCDGRMSGYCGAANCSIDVFLSSQSFAHRAEFLGLSAGFVALNDGRTGVQIGGTYGLCGDTGLCPGPLVWNGAAFALAEEDRVGSDLTPPETPAFLQARLMNICNGWFGVQLDAIGQADFDGDGAPDYIVDGQGLECSRPQSRPYCGASNCTVSVYLSSLGYESAGGFLGVDGFTIGFSADGRPGYRRGQTGTGPIELWNGSAFVALPQ